MTRSKKITLSNIIFFGDNIEQDSNMRECKNRGNIYLNDQVLYCKKCLV